MKKEYLYKSICPVCGSEIISTFGVGIPLKRNFKPYCDECEINFKVRGMEELNISGKDVIIKALEI